MDQQSVAEQNKPEYPSRNKTAVFIIGGVVFLIVVVIAFIFFFVRARTSDTKQQGNTSALTPQPTPNFYQLVTKDIQTQGVKLGELGNDTKELDAVLAYQSVNFSDVLTPPPVQTLEWEAQKIEIAKARAELEIDRRIAVLDKLSSKIDSLKKLSSVTKSQLTNEVETQVLSLFSLKERISGQTNFDALIADINIISDSFKTYQVLVPKVLIVVIADKINALGDGFSAIAGRLAQKTGELRALEKDVATVQKTLGHMLYVLGDAANKAENALILVLPLTSQEFPKNISILQSAKSKAQTSVKNLSLALSDARNILDALKAIESGKPPSGNLFQLFPLFKTQ